MEENEAVRISYCELGLSGWMGRREEKNQVLHWDKMVGGWVGGWVGGTYQKCRRMALATVHSREIM